VGKSRKASGVSKKRARRPLNKGKVGGPAVVYVSQRTLKKPVPKAREAAKRRRAVEVLPLSPPKKPARRKAAKAAPPRKAAKVVLPRRRTQKELAAAARARFHAEQKRQRSALKGQISKRSARTAAAAVSSEDGEPDFEGWVQRIDEDLPGVMLMRAAAAAQRRGLTPLRYDEGGFLSARDAEGKEYRPFSVTNMDTKMSVIYWANAGVLDGYASVEDFMNMYADLDPTVYRIDFLGRPT
jgi:hypothetical protein